MFIFQIKKRLPIIESSCEYVEYVDSIIAANRPNPQETIYLYITTIVQRGKALYISCLYPPIAQILRTGTILLLITLMQ